jgi:surface polysaccharide O-acyltransferase-like enzyme
MISSYDLSTPNPSIRGKETGRDTSIDTMRGIAILMVVGIHSLPQPLDPHWETLVDAALRPSVPIFLFVSGYLTALSGRVPLWKRIKVVLIPYVFAFIAAYIYMALHNPAMNHHIPVVIARFALAYAFVYYYVFVYIGCVIGLWIIMRVSRIFEKDSNQPLVILLMLAIAIGLTVGSYLDPLMNHLGFPNSLVEEVRLRDIPFWLSFASLGMLTGTSVDRASFHHMRTLIAGTAVVAYLVYAAVRLFNVGDAAEYDSMAFFCYSALFCFVLFDLRPNISFLAMIGSGSYFIYLWHIFVVMILRDHSSLHEFNAVADFAATYLAATSISIGVLFAIRFSLPPRFSRWLGA